MNLQETMEAMLDERRRLVGKLTPAEQSRLLHEGLGNLLEQSLYAQGMQDEEVRAQHKTLRQLAGCVLYLLHPEDERTGAELVVAALDHNGEPAGLPSPAPAGQRVRVLEPPRVMVADGKGGWHDVPDTAAIAHAFTGLNEEVRGHEVVGGDDLLGPVLVRKGDGTYKRKPRPDRFV